MKKTLTAHNAIVKTATVEVKTLTISGKQVTLAVFRQLPEEDVLDYVTGEDGRYTVEFKGELWGTVNYHPDKCAKDFKHLHVVWQRKNQLFRSKTYMSVPVYPKDGRWMQLLLEQQLAAVLDLAICPKCSARIVSTDWPYDNFLCENDCKIPYGERKALLEELECWRSEERIYRSVRGQHRLRGQTATAVISHAIKHGARHDNEISQLIKEKDEWMETYKSRYALLASLDQLFIAV